MKVNVTNIEYDTDGEEVDLPKTLEIDVIDTARIMDNNDIQEFVSDKITEITGFCHTGFSMDIKPMTSKEYITDEGANRCPHCRSMDIEGERLEADDTSAWRKVSCNDCENTWTEIFNMTAMEV